MENLKQFLTENLAAIQLYIIVAATSFGIGLIFGLCL